MSCDPQQLLQEAHPLLQEALEQLGSPQLPQRWVYVLQEEAGVLLEVGEHVQPHRSTRFAVEAGAQGAVYLSWLGSQTGVVLAWALTREPRAWDLRRAQLGDDGWLGDWAYLL